MRLLSLLFLLFLHTVAAPGQSRPPLAPADSMALVPSDSATALHRLFVAKRNTRTAVVLGTALVGGLSLALDGVFGSDKISPLSRFAGQGRVVGLTLIAGTGELLYYSQYSREKEQLALLALELHKLSPELRRHLKPRYFQASALAQAHASPVPATAFPASRPPATLTPVDTAAALHRLFAQRRHNGHVTLGTGAGLLAVGGITVAVTNTGGPGALAPFLLGVLGTVASVPLLVRGVVLTVAHTKGREQRVLRAWQQHRLPRRWARRALLPEYTQPQKQP